MKRIMLALGMALGLASAVHAVTAFTYQGVIKDANGNVPSSKNQTIEFRIYNAASGGTALWGRSYSVLLDDTGLFNTALSDSSGSQLVDSSLQTVLNTYTGSTLYVGLTVQGSSGEITPRQAILPVPYAVHADDASSAANGFTVSGGETVSGNKTVSGNLTVNGTTMIGGVLTASSLTVSGEVKAGSSGKLTGYGTIPVGGIVMWTGSSIPDGWAICNGQTVNGVRTPDLRNRFVVGAGSGYSVGNTGGEDKHRLTVAEMPSHNHTMTMWGGDIDDDWKNQNNLYLTFNKYNYNNTRETNYTGGDQAHENRPPYYALYFIMRVK